MSPLISSPEGRNIGLLQSGNSGLEAGIITTVRSIIVSALDNFTLGSEETFFCLGQINCKRLTHRASIILHTTTSEAMAIGKAMTFESLNVHR